MPGLFSPLTLAWGGEYRKEIYGQSRGRPAILWRRSVRDARRRSINEVSPGVFVPTPYVAGSFCAGPATRAIRIR